MTNILYETYLKIKHIKGGKRTIIAIARKLVAYAYITMKRNLTYEELKP